MRNTTDTTPLTQHATPNQSTTTNGYGNNNTDEEETRQSGGRAGGEEARRQERNLGVDTQTMVSRKVGGKGEGNEDGWRMWCTARLLVEAGRRSHLCLFTCRLYAVWP